ncbi:MAG TPA: hypothetical protein DIT99_12250 [Candidatus Latescibacteria bacterium]|jgi:hypothetical protein|nr:hypothetical protein [Candidatus Latescibacterota bacterium]
MTVSSQQKRFFDDFGYIFLPGLMKEEVGWITEEYERLFSESGIVHDGTKRSSLGHIVEKSELLCTLLDHPKVDGLLAGLMGDDYNYLGSGADLYVEDGLWHPDCHDAPVLQVKWAMYLDHLTIDAGALRVVPGSHKQGWVGNLDTESLWGFGMAEVPCVAPDNEPGDVLVFNLQTLHNSLGGGKRRRMLNMVACAACRTEEEITFLKKRIPKTRTELQWEIMRNTAPPQRLRRLNQLWKVLGS